MIVTSLNKEIAWRPLLESIGSPSLLTTASPPFTVDCPFCQRCGLLILPDRLFGGYRYFCRQCFVSGDLLQLAMRVWKLDLLATTDRLQDAGALKAPQRQQIVRYAKLIEFRSNVTAFWNKLHTQHHHNNAAAGLLVQRLNLRCQISDSRYRAGPGQLLGEATCNEVAEFSASVHDTDRKRHRLFLGGGWNDLLVIPFQDMPGRICGLLCGGREFKYPDDFVYVPLLQHDLTRRYESGVAMHPKATAAAERGDSSFIATQDPRLWLYLQFWSAEQQPGALPLVLWHAPTLNLPSRSDTQFAWDRFTDSSLTFWTDKITPAVVANASRCHGSISLGNPVAGSLRGFLTKVKANQRPWRQAFQAHANRIVDSELENFLLEASHCGVDLSVAGRLPEVQERIESVLHRSEQSVRAIPFQRGVVTEQYGVWSYRPSDATESQLVCDAILRIDQVISPDNGEVLYRGRILYQEEVIPFCDSKSVIDRAPGKWLWKFLVKKQRGLVCFLPTFSKELVFLAMQFHEPTLITSPGAVGWDAERKQFILPGFSLSAGQTPTANDVSLFVDDAPGCHLQIPVSPIDQSDADAVQQLPPEFWGAAAALLQMTLSDVYDEQPLKVGVMCHFSDVRLAAQILDCPVLRSKEIRTESSLAARLRRESEERWPIVVDEMPSRRLYRRLNNAEIRCAVPLLPVQAAISRMMGGWLIVSASQAAPEGIIHAVRPVRRIISAWLIDLARREFAMAKHGDLATEILNDMHSFLSRRYITIPALAEAHDTLHVWSDGDAVDAFAELLADSVVSGRLKQGQVGFVNPATSLVLSDEELYVPFQAFSQHVLKPHVASFDANSITRLLAAGDVLIGEEATGWRIDGRWWRRCLRRYRAEDRLQLQG